MTVMARSPRFWLGIVPLWAAVAFVAWEIEHRTIYRCPPIESFRGGSVVSAPAFDESERADHLVELIQAFRDGGYEARRKDFDLPEGWSPPRNWTAPQSWTPPDWWPTMPADD